MLIGLQFIILKKNRFLGLSSGEEKFGFVEPKIFINGMFEASAMIDCEESHPINNEALLIIAADSRSEVLPKKL